jgi:hypothetical protein
VLLLGEKKQLHARRGLAGTLSFRGRPGGRVLACRHGLSCGGVDAIAPGILFPVSGPANARTFHLSFIFVLRASERFVAAGAALTLLFAGPA